jgi:hypothetical protein
MTGVFLVFFVGWGKTESTWYVGHYLAYCTSPGWQTMMSVEQSMEWKLVAETKVLRENLPQYHFVHYKSQDMTWARTRLLTARTAHVVFLNPSKQISGHLEWPRQFPSRFSPIHHSRIILLSNTIKSIDWQSSKVNHKKKDNVKSFVNFGASIYLKNVNAVYKHDGWRYQRKVKKIFLKISYNITIVISYNGARGSVVGWGATLQAGRSRVQVPMRSLDFFQVT